MSKILRSNLETLEGALIWSVFYILASCDYRMFGPLKDELDEMNFSTDNEIKEVVHGWLRKLKNKLVFLITLI